MANISEDIQKRAREWVSEVENNFDNLSQRVRSKWGDWYRMYRTFENQQKLPGQSDVFIPKVYEIIEKKVPAVISSDPRFIATARTNNANASIGIVRDMLGFWWDEDKMKDKTEKWLKESLIYGVGFIKPGWIQETGVEVSTNTEIDEETGETIEVETEEEVVLFERPTADLVSIFDIKVDPRVENFQDGIGVIQYIHDVRYAELLEFDEDIYDLSEIKKLETSDVKADSGVEYPSPEARDKIMDEGINELSEDIDVNKMTLVEYWGVFSPTGESKDEKEYILTTIVVDEEHKYTIRVEENELSFRPFVKLDDRVIRGEFYSIGEVEPLEGLQIEYNNLRNARIDFNNAINYPEWIYNTNANINPAHLIHKPNNIIPVDLPLGSDIRSVLRPVDKPIAPITGQIEESQISKDFQTISQTIDFTDRGGSQGFSNTATGIRSRDRQVGAQLGNIVSHLEVSIAEVGVMWLKIAEKFAEDELEIRRDREEDDILSGVSRSEVPNKFTKVNKEILEDAVNNFSIKIEAGSTTADTAEGKAQDAVNIANTAAQFQALGVQIDMEKVFKDILTDSFQKTNVEEYIKEQLPQLPEGGMPQEQGQGGPQGGKVPLQPSQPTNRTF